MPPRAVRPEPSGLGTSARVLRPKPVNRPPMVLRPKPPNRAASSVPRTRPPPAHVLPPQTSTALAQSTWPLHVLLRPSMSKCQPPRLAARRSGPSNQASRPPLPRRPVTRHGTSPTSALSPRPPASRHGKSPLGSSPRRRHRLRARHLRTPQTKRDVTGTPQCTHQDSRSKDKRKGK